MENVIREINMKTKNKKILIGSTIGVIIVLSLFFIFQSRSDTVFKGYVAEVYYSPTCGCCLRHINYLRDNGLEVKPIKTDSIENIKYELNIPKDFWSCHTTKIDKYFIEGHMPIEAIKKLLMEKPGIDGIALPDMPSGSPGMTGWKTEQFVIYAISGGQSQGIFEEV